MNNFMNPYFATGVPQQNSFYPNQQPLMIPKGLNGKPIESVNDISIQDIPNDGTLGYFPSADGNYILSKRWLADGTIQTIKFIKESGEEPSINMEDILHRVEELEKKVKVPKTTKET